MKMETLCLHGGTQPDPTTLSRGVPVHRTSSYVFRNSEHAANLFALKRAGQHLHPPDEPHHRRAGEAGGRCWKAPRRWAAWPGLRHQRPSSTRSSTSAQAGDNIVSARNLYGGTYTQFNDILPTLGITVKFVDAREPRELRQGHRQQDPRAVRARASPTPRSRSPTWAIADIAHAHGLPLIVDSTFSTPYLHPAHRPRRRHRGALAHQVVGRPRHRHRRHRGGLRQVQMEHRQASRSSTRARHLLSRPALGP
jgi:O-acetylhomoserine (thiol)-lyase